MKGYKRWKAMEKKRRVIERHRDGEKERGNEGRREERRVGIW